MICRRVFSLKLMHTDGGASHKGAPTAHCTYSRSDPSRKRLIYNKKLTCLFFDQVNNYSKFRCLNQVTWPPSTDLSTDIVDKPLKGCRTRAYGADLVTESPIG